MNNSNRQKTSDSSNVFQPVGNRTPDRAVRLSASSNKIFMQKLQVLKSPRKTSEDLAMAHGANAASDARNIAENIWDTEPVRAEQQARATATVETCAETLPMLIEEQEELQRQQVGLPKQVDKPVGRRRLFQDDTRPESASIVGYVGALGVLASMETVSAVCQVMDTSLAAGARVWTALCFSGIFIGGPLIAFKFGYAKGSEALRQAIHSYAIKFGVPATIGGIWVFAVTVGGLQGATDYYDATGPALPYWFLSGVSMTLLAISMLMVEVLLADVWEKLTVYVPDVNDLVTELGEHINILTNAIRETRALHSRATQILKQLDADRTAFVIAVTAEFQRLWSEEALRREEHESDYESKAAQLKAEHTKQKNVRIYDPTQQEA